MREDLKRQYFFLNIETVRWSDGTKKRDRYLHNFIVKIFFALATTKIKVDLSKSKSTVFFIKNAYWKFCLEKWNLSKFYPKISIKQDFYFDFRWSRRSPKIKNKKIYACFWFNGFAIARQSFWIAIGQLFEIFKFENLKF